MKTIHDRYIKPQQNSEICDILYIKFKDRFESSCCYRVFESGRGIYQVQDPNTGLKVTVNLLQWYCTCKNFREYLAPCSHAITACRYDQKNLFSCFADQYTINAYRETYKKSMTPISIQDLESHPEVLPSYIRKLRGRPKTKRHRKKDWNRKSTYCRICGLEGHNRRSCRN